MPEEKTDVGSLIKQAIESKAPVEVMERLLTLQKDTKSEEAREEFVKATSQFLNLFYLVFC